MTCIVGYIDKEANVWMGGDCAGCTTNNVWQRDDPKVFIADKMIYGFTSSFRMGQILRFSFSRPSQSREIGDYEYMCTIWIDALRKCLRDKGFSNIKDNVETGGDFLVGYKGKLYGIENDFQVGIHSLNYDACGCGEDFALASMFTLEAIKSKASPSAKIEIALRSAARFSAYVREPFTIEVLRK